MKEPAIGTDTCTAGSVGIDGEIIRSCSPIARRSGTIGTTFRTRRISHMNFCRQNITFSGIFDVNDETRSSGIIRLILQLQHDGVESWFLKCMRWVGMLRFPSSSKIPRIVTIFALSNRTKIHTKRSISRERTRGNMYGNISIGIQSGIVEKRS